MAELKVGARIAIDYSIGTVKFIGLVPPSSGEWIGVDWDDPTRGKHDGSKDGISYFTCKYPTSGSFVRRAKVTLGESLCEVLKERYLCNHKEMIIESDMYLATQSGQRKVNAVGTNMQQARQLSKLREATLTDQLISSVGPPEELKQMIPNIVELNLSKNLLSSWQQICSIASNLPKLKILNVSQNALEFNKDCLKMKDAFQSVQMLILNKSDLTWDEILTCAELWPDVAELHLHGNRIGEMRVPPPNLFAKLTFLNLSGNKIHDWQQIEALNPLPCLTKLNLCDCGLSKIVTTSGTLPKLKRILLDQNQFEDHDVFNELNKFASLEDVFFLKNPVNQNESAQDTRDLAVAKIRHLLRFNNSDITDRDRCSAELDYLKKFGLQWKDSGGNQDPEKNNPSREFLDEHPRYMDLVREYGAPADHELVRKSTALKGNLIEVSIRVENNPDFRPVAKRLPLTMTVGHLKVLVQRLTKIEVRKQRLVYMSKLVPDHVVTLDRDTETLYDVSIDPGDTIEVRENYHFNRQRYIVEQRQLRLFKR